MNIFQRILERGWWAILAIFLAGAAWSGLLLPAFRIEFGSDVLLNEKDPDLGYYNQTRADWGDDEYLIVCARRDGGWFTREGAETLCEFAKDLRGLPGARSITSITTVPLLRNGAPGLLPAPVYLAGPDGKLNPKVNLEKAREELVEHTLALGNVISADGLDTSVIVYLQVNPELVSLEKERRHLLARKDAEAATRLKEIEPKYQQQRAELALRRRSLVDGARELTRAWEKRIPTIRLSGLPIINVGLLEHIHSDILNFGVLALAVFTLALLAVYRRIRWLCLPLVACLLPVGLMLGVMSFTGQSMTIVTSNMPVLLFVLMLPYAVYFIERYNERRRLDPSEPVGLTCSRATAEIWRPCLYSALATMAGTAAHIGSGIYPVRTFGVMMTFGTGIGLATTMLLIPASAANLPPLEPGKGGTPGVPSGPLRPLTALVLRAPLAVVVFSLALLGVSIWGTLRLQVETKFIDYFWQRSEIYQGLDYIDRQLGGTTPIEVVLKSDKKGFFKTEQGLDALEAAAATFRDDPAIGNVRSLKTLVDEVRKSMKKSKPETVAGLLTKLAPELVEELCNRDATQARVLVRLKETSPLLNRGRLISTVRSRLDGMKDRELAGVESQVTGVCLLYSNILNGLITTMKHTFLIAVVAIWFMLWFLFRSPVMASIVLLPQVLPVFLVLGVMGFSGIALDMVTVVIASVAMGVGIDAAIQYAFRFRNELAAANGDFPEAVRRSHATIGRAILIATVITFAGFLMLMLSHFVPTFYFGLFTGLAILMGLFASLTTLPALFVLTKYPRQPKGPPAKTAEH
ncbi:MAG: MMPL family transporter [Planctomycetia bacterium]|nr:MMPL family transporter [Planctomycetia bacterium]